MTTPPDRHLMTDEALVRVTGFVRYGKQAEWFKHEFGITVVRAADGKLVMTWALFDALQAKAAGLRSDAPALATATLHFD